MHEELLRLVTKLEQAVNCRDALTASAILHQLNGVTIYSGNEVYDRLRALEGKLGVFLFEGFEPTVFGEYIAKAKYLHDFEIWNALEEISERVSSEALWAIKDYMGFPSPDRCPRLFAKLATADNDEITRHLIETIDRLAASESSHGISLSAHERAMSTFRFIRWSPDDKGLADYVRLLAARTDAIAQAACERYLMNLPWGEDRRATLAMLSGVVATQTAEGYALLKKALVKHQQPMILRMWLWQSLGKYDRSECLLGMISDFPEAKSDRDRIVIVDSLGGILDQANSENAELELAPIISATEEVNTGRWSRIVRGHYGTMLRMQLPRANINRVSRPLDRALISIARAWESLRIDHMGCLIPIMMIGLGWLGCYGLNKMLGEPSRGRGIPFVLFCSWIIWSLANMRTHFSGHETIQRKVIVGMVYFALLLAAIIAAVVVRIA